MNRLIALTALLTLCAGQAAAQCGSSCAPAFGPTARLLEGWHPSQQWPGWQLCYVRGVVVAGYRQDTDAYCTYDAASNRWGQATAPPWGARTEKKQNFGVDESKLRGAAVKEGSSSMRAADEWATTSAATKALIDDLVKLQADKVERVENFGLDTTHLTRGNERYSRGGRTISREEALRAAGGSLTDDSGKLRLTVIGTEAERNRVLTDLEQPPLAELKPKLLVQTYAPDHWHLKAGFKTDGKPTIYLQGPADASGFGPVLHREDSYPGPQVLAQAIRRADPHYDPAKDPNSAKPKGPNADSADGLSGLIEKLPGPKWLYVVALAGAGLYYFRDKLATAPQRLAESFEAVQAPAPRARQEAGYRPVARPHTPSPAPPPPLTPPAAIQSRPELTIGRLLQDQLEREQREEEAARRRAAEREAERAAFRKFAGLDVPGPNPVAPVPAPSPEPDPKG